MKKQSRRGAAFRPGLGLLAVLALTVAALTLDPPLAVSPVSAQDADANDEQITVQECRTAYYASSARLSCSNQPSISVSENRCRISVSCQNRWYVSSRPDRNVQDNDVTVTLNDAYNLSNCNGSLRVGSC